MVQPQASLFLTHGAPSWLLDPKMQKLFQDWGRTLPRPQSILIVSAHWETPELTLGELCDHENLIYDFNGFSPELYELQYPAPGAKALATKVSQLLGRTLPQDSNRGLDHGVWVPLQLLFPEANIPILQLSLPSELNEAELFALGQQLAPLRVEGTLIIGSGSMTHNLRELDWTDTRPAKDWVVEFDQFVKQRLLAIDTATLFQWLQKAPHAQRNHPTPEHFRPLFFAWGAGLDQKVQFPIQGFQFATLSYTMASWG